MIALSCALFDCLQVEAGLGHLDITSSDVSLEGLDEQLDKFADHEVVRAILDQVLPDFETPELQTLGSFLFTLPEEDQASSPLEPYMVQGSRSEGLFCLRNACCRPPMSNDRYVGHVGGRPQGSNPKQYRQQYEEKLRAAEMEAIQDYIAENHNLVTLHQQVPATCHIL